MPTLDPAALVGPRVARARGLVAEARAVVTVCRDVPWVGAAADEYRAALDEVAFRLAALLRQLDGVLGGLGLGGSASAGRVTLGAVAATAVCWGQAGRAVRVGGDGYVSVDPAALADAADRLAGAGRTLGGAQGELAALLWWTGPAGVVDPAAGVRERVRGVLAGANGPGHAADRLGELAATTRAVAHVQEEGETTTRSAVRGAVAVVVGLVGQDPWLRVDAARWALPAGVGVAGGGLFALRSGGAGAADGGRRVLTSTVRAGGAQDAVTGLAAVLRGAAPGTVAPSVGPVGDAAPLLARTFGPAAPVRVAAVDDPPVLAPAGSVAGLIGLVMRSDDWPGPDGTAPAPSGTVTVQRLNHADGTRSWVVAIPGTQTWLPGSDNTLDGESDLQVLAGAADSATAGVLGAMAAAGIPDDEPVVLVGHSLGGMVAMSVAAVAAGAGAYRVGAVVTAGSPTVARAVPAAVPVIRLEHDEDAIPQLDGEPTRVAGNVTRVGRAMGDTVYAHGIEEYRTTARLLDEAAATAPGSAPAVEKVTAVLGGQGTAATTTQYRMTRTDVATSSPASAGSGGGR